MEVNRDASPAQSDPRADDRSPADRKALDRALGDPGGPAERKALDRALGDPGHGDPGLGLAERDLGPDDHAPDPVPDDHAPDDRVARILAEWRRERPELDPSPMGVIGRIHRIGLHLSDELTRLYRQHGLGEGDFDVLATLRRAGHPYARTPSELAAWTMVTTGAMTKRVDRLEGAGLVSRRVSDADGRGRVVQLTDAGRELIDEAYEQHLANERRLLKPLPEHDRAALARILSDWLSLVERTPQRTDD